MEIEIKKEKLQRKITFFTLQATSIFLQSWTHDGKQWNTWHLNELSTQCMIIPQKLKAISFLRE